MRTRLWLAGLGLLALGACATTDADKKAAADPPPITRPSGSRSRSIPRRWS